MRRLPVVIVLFACVGCKVPLPRVPGLTVSLATTARVDVHAQVEAAVPIRGAAVVEFFGVPLDGADEVVFVLDRSGSMDDPAQGVVAQAAPVAGDNPTSPPPPAPKKIDVARQELVDALERLPAGTRIDVIFFNDGLDAFAPDIITLDDGGRAGMIRFVTATEASGSTALAPAMRAAFLLNAHRIVLLSDGLGNVGGNAQTLLRDAREAIRGGVRIDTIGLGKDQDASLLGSLASESGGIYQAL